MSWPAEQPAVALAAGAKACADARCATLLAADAEICDECGGTAMHDLDTLPVVLTGWAAERPVVFALPLDRPSIIGRSTASGPTPDIDLRRFPNSNVVHRRHAFLELEDGEWRLTHLGTNAVFVIGRQSVALEPGQTVPVHSGDTLEIGGVPLQFIVRPLARRI